MLRLGQSTRYEIDGKTWTVGRLTKKVVDQFRDWVAEQIGDPYKTAKLFIDKVDSTLAGKLIKDAEEICNQLSSFTFNSDLAKQFLKTEIGMAKLFQLLLLEHHPNASHEDGFSLVVHLTPSQQDKLIEQSAGESPKNGEPAGPK